MRRWSLEAPLLLAVFADLFGFGMLISGIQLRAERLVPVGWPIGLIIGALLAVTFVIQVLVSPWWGRRSDVTGRKPILLTCQVLSGCGLLAYAGPDSLWTIVLSRCLSGLGAANVAIAQAQIADAYASEERTAPLGRLSAALSAGLVLGPPIGGFLHRLPGGAQWVGFVAGGMSLAGALAIWAFVPHSQPTEARQPGSKRILFDLSLLKDFPEVKGYFSIAAVAWLALATLEGTFARLISKLFGYGEMEFGIIFGFESLLAVLIPAIGLAAITARYRSQVLLRWSFVLQGSGLALNPLAGSVGIWPFAVLMFAILLYGLGSSISNPVVNGLVSELTPADRQGEVFGLMQGARSIGFIVGPLVGGAMFDLWPASVYFLAGGVCLFAAVLVPAGRTTPTARRESEPEAG